MSVCVESHTVICMKLQVDRHTDIIWDDIYLHTYITVIYPYALIVIRMYYEAPRCIMKLIF